MPTVLPARHPPLLCVDARLWRYTGIGRYLRAVLPLAVKARPDWQWQLLALPGDVAELRQLCPEAAPVATPIRPLSLRDQLDLAGAIPTGTDLLWVPHFNVPWRWRGRLAATIHDLLPIVHPDWGGGRHKAWYARWLMRHIARQAATVFFNSAFTAGEFARWIGPARAAQITPLAVDAAFLQPAAPAGPRDGRTLLYVGNVKPHKNLSGLLAALPLLRQPWRLIIIGRLEALATADHQAYQAAQALGDRVSWRGEVDDAALRAAYAEADVLAFPSRYEGFGLPALEAMAAGCAVLAANAGALPEVCCDAAVYCDPESPADIAAKLDALLADRVGRETLVARGRNRVAVFSWQRCADLTVAGLDRALGHPESAKLGVAA